MLYLDNIESAHDADSIWYYRDKTDYGTGVPDILPSDIIFTQSSTIYNRYINKGYKINFISSYLGLKEEMGLYEVFSFFFDGKIQSDFDMVDALFSGYLVDSDWCFCLKIGVTFCWFVVSDKKLIKLGKLQFSESISKYTVGKFIKRLRYNIAKSGININRLKFLTWNDADLANEFSNYIYQYDGLQSFFSKIVGFHDLKLDSVVKLLSNDSFTNITAEYFVDCLSSNFNELGLYEKDGVLYSANVYIKDFTTYSSPIINKKDCTYGIILDCEGKLGGNGSLSDGCRELGGIIYCKYDNKLINIDTFFCDSLLLEDTLLQVISNCRNYTQSLIPVLTFGNSDGIMLDASIHKLCKKRSQFKIFNTFRYVDCRPFICHYIENEEISIDNDKFTLTNIARGLGVKPCFPKHSPVNDAKTLFNILAKILLVTDCFVI